MAESDQFTVPIMLVAFNRPDLLRPLLQSLQTLRPSTLYIASDGPRQQRAEDGERVAAVRALVDELVDWPCALHKCYREQNLGCKNNVSQALAWVFNEQETAIILEDDCRPHPSFFPYCQALLERYRDDQRVGMITGRNNAGEHDHGGASYFFSPIATVWGWATWRRAVTGFAVAHECLQLPQLPRLLGYATGDEAEAGRIAQGVADSLSGGNDSWAFPWTAWLALRHQLTVVPARNLVNNVGFDEDSTHTLASSQQALTVATQAMTFPLRHPSVVVPDLSYSRAMTKLLLAQGRPPWWRRTLTAIPGLRASYRWGKRLLWH